MCVTQQSNWSSPRPAGALRQNHASPRTRTNLRCSSGRKRTGPYGLAFLSLEVEPPSSPKGFRGVQTSELKRAFEILHLGSRKSWTSGVVSSKGEKIGPGAQAVTEDERLVQSQQRVLRLRWPPSAPKIEIEIKTAIVESGDLSRWRTSNTRPKVRNLQRIRGQKTQEFRRREHPFRETGPNGSSLKHCGPKVDEVIAAVQQRVHKIGDMDNVMENYHSVSKTDTSNVLTKFQLRRDWRGAVQFFTWMKTQAWYTPNAHQYTRLIGFLGREGKVDLACTHFQEMLLQKCKPDQYTFTAMINAYGKAKMYNEAVVTYMRTARNDNCKPSTVTCNALVDCLVKGGKYDLAYKIVIDMKEGKNGLDFQCNRMQ